MKRADEVGDLSRALAAAADDRVHRVVAMVDAMPERGEADALIAPLRPRLAALRPPRPMHFTRLLFRPLDPVIVPSSEWQPGSPAIPRPALAALAREARRDWNGIAAIDEQLVGCGSGDLDRMLAIGGEIWTGAAPRLLAAARPPDWTQVTGLAQADFAPIARAAALVLSQGAEIFSLTRAGAEDAPHTDDTLRRIFAGAIALAADAGKPATPASSPATSFATLLAVLIRTAPHADHVLAAMEAAAAGNKALLVGAQQAQAFVLARMEAAATSGSLTEATDAMRRAAAILADLDTFMAFRPAPRQLLQEARHRLDMLCRARFEASLQAAVVPSVQDAAGMEQIARDARRFEEVARCIGGKDFYDAARQAAIARLDADLDADPRADVEGLPTA